MRSGSHRPPHAGHAKLAIPRLKRPDEDPPPKPKTQEIPRVNKACSNCRRRKVKCTGELPRCRPCENSGVTCIYEPHRKDRLKTQSERNRNLILLLRDLSLRVGNEDKIRIDRVLDGAEFTENHDSTASSTSRDDEAQPTRVHNPETIDTDHGAHSLPPRHESVVRSITDEYMRIISATDADPLVDESEHHPREDGPIGTLNEDLLRSQSSREIGFVGSMSEIHWLRMFLNQAQPPYPASPASFKGTTSHIESTSYYLDGGSVELDTFVDPHELPDKSTAKRLFYCYTNTVHGSFPILPESFEVQFEKLYDSIERGRPLQAPNKWQALLNLVFAIGARFSHLVDADWQKDDDDHLVYMTRASQLLGIRKTAFLLSAPDGSLIQALGLLAFYFLVIGHVSRAWSMIGMALRSALVVGLHLRNQDASIEPEKRKALVRTWWGLHSVESVLSSITGRPSVVTNEHITVPLPHNLSKDPSQATSAEKLPFLDAHIMIGLITQDVLVHLYSQRTAVSSSEQLQPTIASLMAVLDHWALQALPQGFSAAVSASESPMERQRLIFVFYYYKTKILITRPCLQRLEPHNKDQRGESAQAIQKAAEDCVSAALDLTSMLPSPPDPRWLYETGPWWIVVHCIMQALTVLILETTYGRTRQTADPTPAEGSITKLLRWLKCMRARNAVAKRAYDLISSILLNAGPLAHTSVREFLLQDESNPTVLPILQALHDFSNRSNPTPRWATGFEPGPSTDTRGQGHFDFALPTETSLGQGTNKPMAPDPEDSFPADWPYPLQPVAVWDFLTDPWSPEESSGR